MFCSLLTQAINTQNYSSNPNFAINITLDDQGKVDSISSTLKFEHDGKNFEMHSIKNEDIKFVKALLENPEVNINKWQSKLAAFSFFETKQDEEATKEPIGFLLLSNNKYELFSKSNDKELGKKILESLSNTIMHEYIKIFNNKNFSSDIRNIFSFVTNTVLWNTDININTILSISPFFKNKEDENTQELFSTLNNNKDNESNKFIVEFIKGYNLYENELSKPFVKNEDKAKLLKSLEEFYKEPIDEKKFNKIEDTIVDATEEQVLDQLYQNAQENLPQTFQSIIFHKIKREKHMQTSRYYMQKIKELIKKHICLTHKTQNTQMSAKQPNSNITELDKSFNAINKLKVEYQLHKLKKTFEILFYDKILNKNNTYSVYLKLDKNFIKITIGYCKIQETIELNWEQNFYTSNNQAQAKS